MLTEIQKRDIRAHIYKKIGEFRSASLDAYEKQTLNGLLGKMNPFLHGLQGDGTPEDLVRRLMDTAISRSETTRFGQFLEGVAVYVAEYLHNGQKPGTKGLDLDFTRDGVRYFVSIKSSPNWGNADQHRSMKVSFKNAMKVVQQGDRESKVVCVLGCMYGRMGNTNQGDHYRYCGQDFWEFLSGDAELYQEILDVIRNGQSEDFRRARDELLKKMTLEFIAGFCDADHRTIQWDRLLAFNSGARDPN